MFLKQANEIKKIIRNMEKQGKSKVQIQNAVSLYLKESKKKINPNGELDVI